MRKSLLIVAALLAAAVAGSTAPVALADCPAPTVSYVGNDWGPTPLWRVSVPGASWDVAANSAEEALALTASLVSCPAAAPAAPAPAAPADPAAPAPAPDAPASAPASDAAVGQATQLVTDADVTYVGDSWGPVPIWRVHVPSRNATYDVAAATADAARAAVLGTVAASIDQNPVVAAPSVGASLSPSLAAESNGAPVSVDTSVAAPVVAPVRVVAPAKSKTAKRGVHATPATSRKHR